MEDFSDHVMIALLPITTDWCHIEKPHMTLVYAGRIDDQPRDGFNQMAKDASSIAAVFRPMTLRVLGKDIFGDEEDKVDVFLLEKTPELEAMQHFVDIYNASEHLFRPHVTIGPAGQHYEIPPRFIAFDRIQVSWGKEDLTFWLKKYSV